MAIFRSGTETRLWCAIAIFALLGIISWGVDAHYANAHNVNALHLSDSFRQLLGIGIWAGVVAACAILLKAISNAHDFLKAVAAMWRPVVLICAAGYLLFFNDQGRELGLSLLSERYGWPLVFLFIALIYWAANTWHTARLGIAGALENGVLGVPPLQLSQLNPNRHVLSGDERWLYWLPRLLGILAHLFAAINLSLAAWSVPRAAWGNPEVLRWLAWSAPLAILLATAFVWAFDVRHSSRGRAFARPSEQKLALWLIWGSCVGELGLLGGLTALASLGSNVPVGFVPATIIISSSAVAFLGAISWLRRKQPLGREATLEERASDDQQHRRQITFFTVGLFLVALFVALAVWISPTHIGWFFGSMVVVYFAFGAILALLNFSSFAIDWAIESNAFGERVRAREVGVYALAFVIILGVVNAWLHPFHRVRACDGACDSVISPDQRPTVGAAASAWYTQAKAAYDKVHGEGPVPMLVVAAAGGGIRAAYWTATVLEQLESDLKDQGGVRPYLFAISGVSGGSVGATAFEAALIRRDEKHCVAGAPGCPLATNFLKKDFLAPAVASLVFIDAPSSFLPDLGQGDRGSALEESFEQASDGLLARPFLSFSHFAKDSVVNGAKESWRPILLLNATHEESGNRIITSHVLIERNVFIDSLDALHELGKDVRASTAAHNSARFTYVSPAGDLGYKKGSVIDGGYFENYGALSALEVARAARVALKNERPGVKLVVLMISSDPSLESSHMLVRINEVGDGRKCLVSVAEREKTLVAPAGNSDKHSKPPNYFSLDPGEIENALINEFLAPFRGLENVREAHGNFAAAELAVEVCTQFHDAPKFATEAQALSPQTQTAATLDDSKDVSIGETKAVEVKFDSPYFAHLAMCNVGNPAPIQPPLGWVLSQATQESFSDILEACENGTELRHLETALGRPTLQQSAHQ
jgi:hypothetical protein